MEIKGKSEEELFCFLSSVRSEDTGYDFILSSMCTTPHPVAVRAHNMFMETNLGDPGLFPGTASLERMLVKWFGELYNLPDAGGYATSGGTESNIQVLRIAKLHKNCENPNVVLPDSVHFSFKKACDMLGIEMRPVPIDKSYRMDAEIASEQVDKNTCCIVGVAGTTEYGIVDPIKELSGIAADADVMFHVDAAFGGLVLPFLDDAPKFDFELPGVTSISVDPHKMGMSTIPAGALLFREPEVLNLLNVETPYLTVKQEYTLAGTRPGASVAGAVAVLEYLGVEGMKAVVQGCMKNTARLIAGMEAYGIQRVVTPEVNVAAFEKCAIPEPWVVSWTRQGDLRIVCMPHVTSDRIEAFLEDIGDMNA